MRPRVRKLIAEHADHADLIILSSRRAARLWLERALAAEPKGSAVQ
jgi:uroporphyrinogen-III synthase